jgi:hypothetical protein
MLYVYRLWTIPVGKLHTLFRGLKGNRVLYGNSFESDDTEDFPKASKPYIWPDISPTLLYYADTVFGYKKLWIHPVCTNGFNEVLNTKMGQTISDICTYSTNATYRQRFLVSEHAGPYTCSCTPPPPPP